MPTDYTNTDLPALRLAQANGRLHVEVADGWVDVSTVDPLANTLIDVLREQRFAALVAASKHAATTPHITFDTPIQPGQLFDCYAFEAHVKNAREKRGLPMNEDWYDCPVYYRSNPRGLVPPGGTVLFPHDEAEPDFELELGVVIGKRISSPTLIEAEDAIFGYTLFNDWSARVRQRAAMKVGLGPNPGKDFATSLGPTVVTKAGINLNTLELEAWVDGERWSHGQFSDIRWSFAELIAFIADGVELLPGDVIGSGTIGTGCGFELGRVLPDGARVELSAAPIGKLTGIVGRAPERSRPWLKRARSPQ